MAVSVGRSAADGALARRAAAGDAEAFARIFERYHTRLLSYCRHTVGDPDDADDALQQTFIRADRALRRSGAPRELRPWLYAIARNCCRDVVAARRPIAVVGLAGDELVGFAPDVHAREDLRALVGDIAALPEDQRTALLLAELEGMSHAHIAVILRCPATKVKALVYQARATLLAERAARETPCPEIREQLAAARGGALRRAPLRRHLRGCEGCRAFAESVRGQREALALVLPVMPSAGLVEKVLGGVAAGHVAKAAGGTAASAAAAGGAGAAGAGSTGGLLGLGAAAKVAAVIAAAGLAAAGAIVAGSGPGPSGSGHGASRATLSLATPGRTSAATATAAAYETASETATTTATRTTSTAAGSDSSVASERASSSSTVGPARSWTVAVVVRPARRRAVVVAAVRVRRRAVALDRAGARVLAAPVTTSTAPTTTVERLPTRARRRAIARRVLG